MHTPEDVARLFEAHGKVGGLVYDASCGAGASSNLLRRMGFEVVCSTFTGRPSVEPEIRWVEGVDLNRKLPFEAESFDCAVLQEVIEHLENPVHVIREFNRVLRPGGLWALTFPNASNLRSRVHYLFSGFVKGRRRPTNYDHPPGNYLNLFIPALPTLHYLLWVYGFRVVELGRGNRKRVSWLLWLVLIPFVWAWTVFYTRPEKDGRTPRQVDACRDLRALLLAPHVLLDENLVLLLEKRHSIDGLYAP